MNLYDEALMRENIKLKRHNHRQFIVFAVMMLLMVCLAWYTRKSNEDIVEKQKDIIDTINSKYETCFQGYCNLTEIVTKKNNIIKDQDALIKDQNTKLTKLLPLAFDQIERDAHIDEKFLTEGRKELLVRLLDVFGDFKDSDELTVTRVNGQYVLTVMER